MLFAQVTQGGEYINTVWINLLWSNTLNATPILTNFQVGTAYNFDTGVNGVLFHNPSGKQLSTPVPTVILIDLLLPPCNTQTVTFTDSVTGQPVTVSGAGIVQALGAMATLNRSGAAMIAQQGEP